MEYKPKAGLMNGDIVKALLDLCNEYFASPFIKPYTGATPECFFCGAIENEKGGGNHSAADCPVIKYQNIVTEHKKFIETI